MNRDSRPQRRMQKTGSPTWIDSHCHLEMLKEEIGSVLAKSREMGVSRFVTIGTDRSSNRRVDELTKKHADVFGTVGCHPHNASSFDESHLNWMRGKLGTNRKLLGIGECGFDLYYGFSKERDQRQVFLQQLELSVDLKLPVVVHTREAERETMELLEEFAGDVPTGVFHCFTSSLDMAKRVLDMGFYLSFNGICTFPKAEGVRAVLQYTPLDRILLETDSPYLSPVPVRGKPNFPGNVSLVGSFVADFLQVPAESLASAVRRNLTALFPRYDHEN